jgi:hypothetical protein
MTEEQWKAIDKYENYYEVSSHGRVRSVDRVVKDSHETITGVRKISGRILSPAPNRGGSGYLKVVLCKDSKPRTFDVHRLVLETFIGPPPDEMQGCHTDGNNKNNKLENLRWDTIVNNMADKGGGIIDE